MIFFKDLPRYCVVGYILLLRVKIKNNILNGDCKIAISDFFEKAIFSSSKICGNILNMFCGGIKTTNISVQNKFRYIKLHFIVIDSDLGPPLSCISNF